MCDAEQDAHLSYAYFEQAVSLYSFMMLRREAGVMEGMDMPRLARDMVAMAMPTRATVDMASMEGTGSQGRATARTGQTRPATLTS